MRPKSGRTPKPKVERAAPEKREDVVLIQGVSESGDALAVLRARNDRVEAGIVRAVKEGEPVQGELLKLKPRDGNPLLCDVEVQVPGGTLNAPGGSDAKPSHGGPAQVASDSYRANWDAIWKKPSPLARGKKSLPN